MLIEDARKSSGMVRKMLWHLDLMEVDYELEAIETYLKSLEAHLSIAPDLERSSTWEHLRSSGSDEDLGEVRVALQRLSDTVELICPRHFRGAFLVSLWAVFEDAISVVADRAKANRSARLSLNDIQGRSPLHGYRKYFRDYLEVPFSSEATYERLRALEKARNVFAHRAGRLNEGRSSEFKKLADEG